MDESLEDYQGWPNWETWYAFTWATDLISDHEPQYKRILAAAKEGPRSLRECWEGESQLFHRDAGYLYTSITGQKREGQTTMRFRPWWYDSTWFGGVLHRAISLIDWDRLANALIETE